MTNHSPPTQPGLQMGWSPLKKKENSQFLQSTFRTPLACAILKKIHYLVWKQEMGNALDCFSECFTYT